MAEENGKVDLGVWNKLPYEGRQSRRDFLKGLGKAAAAKAVSGPIADAAVQFAQGVDDRQESEQGAVSTVLFVDLVSQPREETLNRMLGEYDRSGELHIESGGFGENRGVYLRSADEAMVRTVIADEILEEREGHGDAMLGTRELTQESMSRKLGEAEMVPLQEVMELDFRRDALGNPVAQLTVDEGKLGDVLERQLGQNPSQKIINMSFQVGVSERTYVLRKTLNLPYEPVGDDLYAVGKAAGYADLEGSGQAVPYRVVDGQQVPLEIVSEEEYQNRNLEYQNQAVEEYRRDGSSDKVEELEVPAKQDVEAYNSKFAHENLSKLADLARRFPDRLFVTAGGNNGNDFYDIKQGVDWPDNLILVGSINGGETEADGCDLYLAAEDFAHVDVGTVLYSSEATAITSTVAELIANANPDLSVSQIKERLLTYCEETEYSGINSADKARSARPERLSPALKPSLYEPDFAAVG